MTATVSTNGEVKLPEEIRELLGVESGGTIDFQIDHCKVAVSKTPGTIEDFMNVLPKAKKSFTVEEMNEAKAKGATHGGS